MKRLLMGMAIAIAGLNAQTGAAVLEWPPLRFLVPGSLHMIRVTLTGLEIAVVPPKPTLRPEDLRFSGQLAVPMAGGWCIGTLEGMSRDRRIVAMLLIARGGQDGDIPSGQFNPIFAFKFKDYTVSKTNACATWVEFAAPLNPGAQVLAWASQPLPEE
jgi:hypothetical protein